LIEIFWFFSSGAGSARGLTEAEAVTLRIYIKNGYQVSLFLKLLFECFFFPFLY